MANIESEQPKVRLDKWLWAARLAKTRSIARDLIQAGKVHYNGQKSKPGKIVEIGATIRVPAGWDSKEIKVVALAQQRQSAVWLSSCMWKRRLAPLSAPKISSRESNNVFTARDQSIVLIKSSGVN